MSIRKARQFRKKLTDEETILWSELKLLRPQGLHFRRQVPREGYFLDFACLKAKVIVEVDGVHHGMGSQKINDEIRDRHFQDKGFLTLRYWNNEIRNELNSVIEDIFRKTIDRLPPPER